MDFDYLVNDLYSADATEHPYSRAARARPDLQIDTTPRFNVHFGRYQHDNESSSSTHVAWSAWANQQKFHRSTDQVSEATSFHGHADHDQSSLHPFARRYSQYHSHDDQNDEDDRLSHADTASEVESIFQEWGAMSVLDPTTIEAGFDYACLDCLGEDALHDPHGAYATACWSETHEAEADKQAADTSEDHDDGDNGMDDVSVVFAQFYDLPLPLPPRPLFAVESSTTLESPVTDDGSSDFDFEDEVTTPVVRHDKPPSMVYHLDEKTSFVLLGPPPLCPYGRGSQDSSSPSNVWQGKDLPPLPPRKNLSKRLVSLCASSLPRSFKALNA